eukprot:365123-Chlamydomonas_euryale.AAC.50
MPAVSSLRLVLTRQPARTCWHTRSLGICARGSTKAAVRGSGVASAAAPGTCWRPATVRSHRDSSESGKRIALLREHWQGRERQKLDGAGIVPGRS